MTPRLIHIPKGGLPRRTLPQQQDSLTCRRIRYGFYVVSGISYAVLVLSWLLGWMEFTNAHAAAVGLIGVMIPLMGDRLIRPGKGKTWALTLGVFLLMLIPYSGVFFFILLPLGLLVHHAFQARRSSHRVWSRAGRRDHGVL